MSEFVDKVYHRGDALPPKEATVRAQAVLQTVEEAVSEGEAGEDAASPLPQEFAPLLGEKGPAESGLPGHHGAAEVSRTALLSNGSIVVSTLRTDLQKSLLFRLAFSIIT